MARKIETAFTLSGETEYKRSIKEISAEQTTLNAELRKVDASMKENGESQEGLKKKSEILTKQVGTQEERIATLNQSLEEANQKYPEGGVEVEKYKKQLHDAERFMDGYKKQLDDTNKALADKEDMLKKVGEQATKYGKKMTDTGVSLTKGLTAPIAGIGAAATAAWSEYDDAIDGIVLATGASGDALEDLEGVYRSVFGSLPVESEQVAGAIGEINTQFGHTGEALEEATSLMVKYSEITGQDVVAATQGAKGIIEAYGLEYEDLAMVLDDVAKAAQDTGADTGALMDMMIRSAPQIDQLGLSTGEAAQMLGQFNQYGLDASNVLGGITRAQVEGAKSGKDLNTVLSDFTDYVASGASEADVLNEAAKLFGTRRGPAMVKAAQQGALDFESLGEAAAGAGGAVTSTFENTLDPIDQAKVAMNNFKLAGADLGTAIQETAAPALDWVADKARAVADSFRNLDTEQQQFIVTLGAGLAAVGPATVAGGKLATMFGNMATRAASAESAAGKLSAALGGGGKMALTGIAIAAATAIYQYARNVDNLSNNLRKSREAVKEAREEYDKSTAAIEDSAGMAMSLVAQIKDLQKAEELSNDEKVRMRTLIGQLNGLYPQLGLEIDEVTGKVKGLEESIDDMVQRMIDQERIAANETVMHELAQEAAGMYDHMTKAEEAWINAKAEAQAEDARLTDEYLDLLARRMGVGDELSEQENERLDRYIQEQGLIATHQMDLMELLFAYDSYKDEYESIQGQIGEIAEDTQDIVTDAQDEVAESAEESSERVSRATEGTIESRKAYREEHVGTLTDMRDDYEWYIDEYGNLQKEDTTNLERTAEEQRIIQENAKQREEDLQSEILANEERWLELRRKARAQNTANEEQYSRDLESELGNQLGILQAFRDDEFKSQKASADQHYAHNEKMKQAYIDYNENLADLRGRVSAEMYAELQKLGPSHAGLIAEYAGMTEGELKKHSDQWVEIYEIMGETAKTEVAKIPEVTAEELGKLEGIIRDEEGNIYNAATDALGYVTEAIRQEAPESEGQMDALVERVREKAKTDLSELGKGAISTYSDAMEDWRPEAEEQAIALALAVFENSDGSLEERGAEAVQTYVDAMAEAEIDAINQAMRMARGVEGAAETHLFDQGSEGIHTYIDGQDSKRAELERKTAELAKIPKEKMNVSLINEGEHGATTYAAGIRNKIPQTNRAAKDMAQAAKTSAKTSFNAEGVNAGASFADGIKSQRWRVQNEAAGLGSAARNSLKSHMQISSPSKVMVGLGQDTGEGFAVGIEDKLRQVEQAAARLGDAAQVSGRVSVTGEVIGGHGAGHGASPAGSMSVNATVDSQVIADAVARGLSGVGVYMDGRSMGQMIAKDSARGRAAVGGIV